jgi:malate synthase
MTALDHATAPPTVHRPRPLPSSPAARPSHRGRIDVAGPAVPRAEEVLTPEALAFLAHLHDRFAHRRAELLTERATRRAQLSDGRELRFRL